MFTIAVMVGLWRVATRLELFYLDQAATVSVEAKTEAKTKPEKNTCEKRPRMVQDGPPSYKLV